MTRGMILFAIAVLLTIPLGWYGFYLFDSIPWKNADAVGCFIMGSIIIGWLFALELGNQARKENREQ